MLYFLLLAILIALGVIIYFDYLIIRKMKIIDYYLNDIIKNDILDENLPTLDIEDIK
jgi:hypothetical protein